MPTTDHEPSEIPPDLIARLAARDGAFRLLEDLPERFPPSEFPPRGRQLPIPTPLRIWEVCGLHYLNERRPHEALALFSRLYDQLLLAQDVADDWTHKGIPLVWMSECYARLGYPLHAKRYLMMTLCEDAIADHGTVSPEDSGIYFRLIWGSGLPEAEFRRYAREFVSYAQMSRQDARFPEALLQRIDRAWATEFPSPQEATVYTINRAWTRRLIDRLGDKSGKPLELLAEYLLSCMPGCRTERRRRTQSTDYDLVCSMDGLELDFRSEFGRYFVCECKDWDKPADFTTMAKFCRVLDSIKARFGILFSRNGISGAGHSINAEREQLKVFQDRGIVIVVIDLEDLKAVAEGANFIRLLRQRYESVRLDIQHNGNAY